MSVLERVHKQINTLLILLWNIINETINFSHIIILVQFNIQQQLTVQLPFHIIFSMNFV